MTALRATLLVSALLVGGGVLEMLRRRQLKEKYAVLWVLVACGSMLLAAFPGLLDRVAELLSVADPPNLLLFGAVVGLLFVCLHLSWETSRLEDETRTLAEEVALLREQLEFRDRPVPCDP